MCSCTESEDTPTTLGVPRLVSQADPLPQEREGSGELRIQALSHRTVQCSPIVLQYFVT